MELVSSCPPHALGASRRLTLTLTNRFLAQIAPVEEQRRKESEAARAAEGEGKEAERTDAVPDARGRGKTE